MASDAGRNRPGGERRPGGTGRPGGERQLGGPGQPGGDGTAHDVVGKRVLVGVQMVDVSRLSTHPVPIISRGLITVAGQGPKDSNGAGKSSFIAALSLLHADEQWRLASGAAGAAELLFTAELAAQDTRWSNADRGYVVGVFADPGATTADELADSALTVWLRINRKAPYLDLRWAHGLHVPLGSTERERAGSVDTLWGELPRSNGRTDIHANRLSTVLYGGHVRCVSFLSTSVRSSPTANLLAQPLNELTPARIFDAIAALTGLDRELEQEQALRSVEHTRREDAQQVERDFEQWERQVAIVEDAIAQRAGARDTLGTAQAAWHGRCARDLLDGVERCDELRDELAALAVEEDRLHSGLAEVRQELQTLQDDAAFGERFDARRRAYELLAGSDRELERDIDRAAQRLTDADRRLRQLRQQALDADGRTVERARQEEAAAQQAWELAIGEQAVARAAYQAARAALGAAEAGDDVAAEQLRRLRDAGIPAAVLLDVVDLPAPPDRRAAWSPRLVPYRNAVVVPAADRQRAFEALRDLPDSMLVLADPPARGQDHTPAAGDLPGSVDQRFALSGFFAALAGRSGAEPHRVDDQAGIVVVGGIAESTIGRAARVVAAKEELSAAEELLAEADAAVTARERAYQLARRRTAAAEAGAAAAETAAEIEELRCGVTEREALRDRQAPDLAAAEREYEAAKLEQATRDQRRQSLAATIRRLGEDARRVEERQAALAAERDTIDLPARQAAWGGTAQAAAGYLASLPEDERTRTVGEWNEEACHRLAEAARLCFPDDTPPEQLPAEVRELLVEQRWRRAGLETRVRLAPALQRALRHHLTNTEQQDAYDRDQLARQRHQRTHDLAAAQHLLTEAARASEVHRSSLATGIKARLKRVADEFDRLDRAYGGYGAGLDYPDPEPPARPDKPWRWAVTPRWRRGEGKRMAPYHLRANTAQLDEKAVKLVCAAALAGGADRPLLLVLDELGRNLGSEHRREAVALFERIGADRDITVVGALQDDMERYAVNASGLYIKLRRSSDDTPYNDAPVVNGSDGNAARVELLRQWLSGYR